MDVPILLGECLFEVIQHIGQNGNGTRCLSTVTTLQAVNRKMMFMPGTLERVIPIFQTLHSLPVWARRFADEGGG